MTYEVAGIDAFDDAGKKDSDKLRKWTRSSAVLLASIALASCSQAEASTEPIERSTKIVLPAPDVAYPNLIDSIDDIGSIPDTTVVPEPITIPETTPMPDAVPPELPEVFNFSDDPIIKQLRPSLPNPEGERKITPKGITLHWWGVNGDGDIKALTNGLRGNTSCGQTGCSSQYGITKNGEIYRMMDSATEFAYHAGVANETTFGIEIEGEPKDFDLNGESFNKEKFEAVVSLVAELVEDYDLPIREPLDCKNIAGIHSHDEYNHCTVPAGKKIDVGEEYTNAVIEAVESMQN